MTKYKLKVKDGEDLVIPALQMRLNNTNFTDAIAEQLITSGRGRYVIKADEKTEEAKADKKK